MKRIEIFEKLPKGSLIAELGVAEGNFSYELLYNNQNIEVLYSIDRWSDHHNEAEYLRVLKRLSPFDRRSKVFRDTFNGALKCFDDESLDAIYIDGYAHLGQEGGKTLDEWYPKLKPGGIFAGHDYHPKYQNTIDTVKAFVIKHNLDLKVTTEPKFPSWYTKKKDNK